MCLCCAREFVGSILCRSHLVIFTLCRSNDAHKETIKNDLLSYLQVHHETWIFMIKMWSEFEVKRSCNSKFKDSGIPISETSRYFVLFARKLGEIYPQVLEPVDFRANFRPSLWVENHIWVFSHLLTLKRDHSNVLNMP